MKNDEFEHTNNNCMDEKLTIYIYIYTYENLVVDDMKKMDSFGHVHKVQPYDTVQL